MSHCQFARCRLALCHGAHRHRDHIHMEQSITAISSLVTSSGNTLK
jgi:hypothetical protein